MVTTHSVPEIAQRWRDPSSTAGEVFLVAHRGAFVRDNHVIEAENSVPAIKRARALGCEMVEIDVHFTRDGTAVVLHDPTLDRTTALKGDIASVRYADIKGTPLVHPATRVPFDAVLPTLEDAFIALGDDLMINVECKTGIEAIPQIAAIARSAGVSHQVTVKTNTDSATRLEDVAEILDRTPDPIDFIPVLVDSRDGLDTLHALCEMFTLSCVECVVESPLGPGGFPAFDRLGFTSDGGPLFSIEARRLTQAHNIRQFINTLYVDPAIPDTQWNGGRNCQLARFAPDSVYSFWIAHGASVIQTDEPEFALDWLRRSGFRMDTGS